MIAVIIAGGAGTRLWPLSTPEHPKHLLNLTGKESLLQGTFRRFSPLSSAVYVVTDARHADLVRKDLPDLPADHVIVEPAPRGTANCLLAGLHKIAADKCDPDEPIAFVSADHFIRDTKGFAASFKIAEAASRAHQKVTQVGIEPTYPATAFGYIHKGSVLTDGSLVFEVVDFKEKPSFEVAQQYVESGDYLWNCSYYLGSHNAFMRDITAYAPELKKSYDKLATTKTAEQFAKTYLSLANDTIDYAFAEREPSGNLLVVPASFDWMDVGSYTELHQAVGGDKQGNFVRGQVYCLETSNSYVENTETKPVAVIGLDNVAVINTPDGVLVTRKDLGQRVKEVAKQVQES